METHTEQQVSTRYGLFTIDGVRDKKMAGALLNGEYPNEGLLEIARVFVDKKSIVVDIGAHIGTFAVPIAAEVEKVIAFEPSHEAYALLSRNASQNEASLQLINKALGREEGSGTLLVRNASNAGANTLITGGDIPVTMLDEEVERANFIKIDVEGMELEVLRGGTRLIERARPVVVFEVNLSQLRAHNTSPRALEQFFTERGYRLYFPLERGNLVFARVKSATLLTALIAPRAWLFYGDSAPFDLIAVPVERPLPSVGFMRAIKNVIDNNLSVKGKQLAAFFRGIL